MPLDSVRGALARSGATPIPGQTTIVYNQGLDDFYANHYSKALEEFRQVKELFPAHAYVGSYISRAQQAISEGKDVPIVPPSKAWLPSPLILVVGGARAPHAGQRRTRLWALAAAPKPRRSQDRSE